MPVSRLGLTGFRSYAGLEVVFGAGPQVVFGPNASGKTNLLEALVVLASGRSHRTSTDAELVRWGDPFARLEVRVERPGGSDELDVVLTPAGSELGRKRLRVNGVARRATTLAAALRVVLFAPEEMLLVVGSPGLRRTAIDTVAGHRAAAHLRSLSTYGRALQQRNGLLRQIRDNLAGRDELAYWDRLLIEEGGRIVAERLATLGALVGPLSEAHREIAPSEGRLSLRYLTNAPVLEGEEPTDALRRRLAETADKELWNGATLVGPHRDDIAFELDARDLAGFASRGQQRTAILALKLAELDLLTELDGRPPLLLLDDVFSELDPDRRAHLVRRIGALPQAFVTTTALEDLDPALVAEATAWRVNPGSLDRVATPAAA